MNETYDLLFFLIRGRRCAIDVASVREVLAAPAITPVPLVPPLIRGAISFHGLPLAVLDLGVELMPGSLDSAGVSFDAFSRSAQDYVLIVEAQLADGTFVRSGLAVERVARVVTVPADFLRPHTSHTSFVSATIVDADGPALLIDVPTALATTMKTIRSGRQAA
ncbi:MAG: chemotaxis protein CheW [Deltaproteobacteria bacterium]|nr:chemotaxis protein CheW [Deltaproteobacteria bacterium]